MTSFWQPCMPGIYRCQEGHVANPGDVEMNAGLMAVLTDNERLLDETA
jgi:hypothetical protein